MLSGTASAFERIYLVVFYRPRHCHGSFQMSFLNNDLIPVYGFFVLLRIVLCEGDRGVKG